MNSETIYGRRIWWIAEMSTVNEYRLKKIVPKTTLPQENQDENRLGREITPTKHGYCAYLKYWSRQNTQASKRTRNDNRTPPKRTPQLTVRVLLQLHTQLSHKHYWQMGQEGGSEYGLSSEVVPCFTTGVISVLTDMNVANNVFFRGFRSTTRSRFESSTVLYCYARKGISLQMFRHNLSVLP